MSIRRISGALGAELTGLDLTSLDDAGFESLLNDVHEHLVVFVPRQDLTPDAHRALGARFGEIEIHPFLKKLDADHPEIVVLESEHGGIADVWHTDVTFVDHPPRYSVLNMLEAPASGGPARAPPPPAPR